MKDVYLRAAKLICAHDRWSCLVVGDYCREARKEYEALFKPKKSKWIAWIHEQFGYHVIPEHDSDAAREIQNIRVLALLFMHAITESERKRK